MFCSESKFYLHKLYKPDDTKNVIQIGRIKLKWIKRGFVGCIALLFIVSFTCLVKISPPEKEPPRSELPILHANKPGTQVRSIYVSPNEILSQTVFLIKTYERRACLIKLLESLHAHSPFMPIIVADDSHIPMNFSSKFNVIESIVLPEDSGVGYGRNRLIQKAFDLGYSYVIMSDDDYLLQNSDLIPKMAKQLVLTGADIVAPKRCRIDSNSSKVVSCSRGECLSFLDGERGTRVLPNITKRSFGVSCFLCDVVQQFFLGKTSVLLNAWDDKLKNNDHYDAMLTLRSRSAKIVMCDHIYIAHNKNSCTPARYSKKRFERWLNLMPYVLDKWNYQWITDEVGRRWSMSSNHLVQTQCGEKCLDFPKFKRATLRDIEHLEMRLNSLRPSYDQIQIVENTVVKQTINDCQDKIYFKHLKVRWANRHSKRPYYLRSNELYLQKWCKDLIRNMMYSMRSEKTAQHLFYIVPLSSLDLIGTTHIRRNFNAQLDTSANTHVVFVVLGKNRMLKHPVYATLKDNEHILEHSGPFGRSIAMKIGFAWVRNRVKDPENTIVFSMDGSMRFPNTFSQRVIDEVRCGVSAFFPVSKMSSKDQWINTGYGVFGMCLSDYFKLDRGWDEKWWYHWGAEDVDMANQVHTSELHLERYDVDGLIHVDHSKKGAYYAKKNMFGHYLPVIPKAIRVTDKIVLKDLKTFLENKLGRGVSVDIIVDTYIMQKTQRFVVKEFVHGRRPIHILDIPIPMTVPFQQTTWRIENKHIFN